MIPHIPDQRKHTTGNKPFNDLVAYLETNPEQEKTPLNREVDDILNYVTNAQNQADDKDKCIAIRTQGINDIATASSEMNEVSARNTRCKDPAYHFILSWPEHERPEPDAIFDAATHALKALGLADHQAVMAIHGNTDNRHCHVAVNRINPITFKSHNIEWAKKTLHFAARESEIKHGWTHDNGIYIVNTNGQGKKTIGLNPKFDDSIPYAHRHFAQNLENILPPWHDPDSLESWLKTDVSRALKRSLPKLDSWNALHTWLANYDIQLIDTGGGGMRLKAASPETGEILDLPASRGLRLLKRADLETRFGPFTSHNHDDAHTAPTPCIVPDLSHLTPQQLTKGVNHVLNIGIDHPSNATARRLDEHLLHTEFDRPLPLAQRAGRLHDVSDGNLAGNPHRRGMLLPDDARTDLGDAKAGQDHGLRRAGAGSPGSRGEKSKRSLTRDDSKRAERAEHRAAARADLRSRFSQYKRFVRDNDADHWPRLNEIKSEYRTAIKDIRQDEKAAKKILRTSPHLTHSDRIDTSISINAMSARRQLEATAAFELKSKALNATRQPPLGWRAWLQEQGNLGDQAALSALRGMVYQAQRDAKKLETQELGLDKDDEPDEEKKAANAAEREYEYKQLMARLLDEERKETAIRSARLNAMRPFEADALLARYLGIKWKVTGNGNVEFSDRHDKHLFTDRGNRVTFDKVQVSDEEIRLALVHAQQKFGKALTLTGDDPIFTARMARLASDMNIEILNPELQLVIQEHREATTLQIAEAEVIDQALTIKPAEQEIEAPEWQAAQPDSTTPKNQPVRRAKTPQDEFAPIEQAIAAETVREAVEAPVSPEQRLRTKVLSIDPRATFVIANPDDPQKTHTGPVAAVSEEADAPMFAQHAGCSVYTVHQVRPPVDAGINLVTVKYANGLPTVSVVINEKGKGRGE